MLVDFIANKAREVLGRATAGPSIRRLRTSGRANARAVSVLIFAIISVGVPAGRRYNS
jgi:hypothetical protein